jgi:hypothetical protein
VLGRQRRLDLPVVVEEPARVARLVIALDDRSVLGDELAQPVGRDHLAVGEMVDDLAGGPFVRGGRAAVELVGRRPGDDLADGSLPVAVARDEGGPLGGRVAAHRVGRTAMASTSTRPLFGSDPTANVERAGGGSATNRP